MAVSGGETEALAARKWFGAIMRDERERERERESRERQRLQRNEEEGKGVHILIFCVIIIDGFSIGNNLMNQFVSLITYYPSVK